MNVPRLKYAGFAVLRSPLLSAADFRVAKPTAAADLDQRIAELGALAGKTPVREALATSSPALSAALAAPPARAGARTSIALAAMRYVERMRGRPTPFGLCAGYTLLPTQSNRGAGTTETAASLALTAQSRYTAVLRIDVDVMTAALRERFVTDRAARQRTRWVASREVMLLGDTAKVYRRSASGRVSFADVVRSEALERVLALPDEGASFVELVALLLPFADDIETRESYVHALIDVGILIPEAYPSIATDDELAGFDALVAGEAAVEGSLPAATLAERSRAHRHGPIGPELMGVASEIEATMARYGLAEAKGETADAGGGAGDHARPSRGNACIFDLLKESTAGSLGPSFLRELSRVVAVLKRLHVPAEDERHRKFRDYLRDRYESREVPIAEALDADYGFYFGELPEPRVTDDRLKDWRLRLYADAIARGAREVNLTDADLPDGPPPEPPPAGFSIYCRVRQTEAGWRVYEPQFVGPPGTLYFGRATAFSSELRERSRAFIEAQAACVPDADFAQLTYFVPGRSASFVQFPTLTPVEVTLAARPGLVAGLRIDVNDIVVRVDGDRVVLRSRATGREILLRPAGAANPNHPDVTPMARFLLTCGRRNWAFEFEWGPLAHAPFLPRISFDGHVLSAAIWNLDPKQIRVLREARTVEARFDAVQRLRAEARLPRHILFAEGVDLHLPVDLDDVLSVEAWLDILGERASIREQFPVEESVVAGPEGPYHHELVVPLLLETSTAKADVRKVAPATTPIPSDRREPPPFDEAATFDRVPPGDRCLFLSIYGGRADLIAIVTGTLRNLLVDARDNRDLTHWFFLPYADPDPHLRLRLFGEPQVLFGKLLFAIRAELEPLIASRVVREIRVGTYHRETVRYGGAQVMDLCEKVFWASSEAAVVFHDAFTGDSTEVKDLLPPVVRSLRGVLLLAGLSPAEARAQAALTGELYTRATDPVAPRRMAGALLREHKAALIDKPNPEALFGSELADRFRNALLDVQAACASGGTWPFNRVFADLLHVHSMRLLTAWCAVADLEATAYFTLEKVLAGEVARST